MNSLEGKIIINTRPNGQADKLTNYLSNEGAVVYNMPLISIHPASLTEEIKTVLYRLDSFDWLIFTSQNGVKHFLNLMSSALQNNRLPERLKIAVFGHKASDMLQNNNITPDFVSTAKSSDEFYDTLGTYIIKQNENVLLALGNLAKTHYNHYLQKRAKIHRINVYNNVCPDSADTEILRRIQENRYDLIIFTSPSTFYNLGAFIDINTIAPNLRAVSIGPVTTAAMQDKGVEPVFTASAPTMEALVKDLIKQVE